MQSRIRRAIPIAIISLILFTIACSSGFIAGRYATPTHGVWSTVETTQSANSTIPPVGTLVDNLATPTQKLTREDLFKPFWEAWDIIHENYVDQPVDDVALMRGAIKGMLEALGDKHTSYMDPDQYRQANIPLEQEYEGIGAWVDTTGKYLTIITPMPGSPAEKAGLKPSDAIVAIDGEDMTGIDPSLALRRVLGPANTQVTLTINREGLTETFDVTITRAKITIPSVSGKMLDNHIAYVQLFQFAENTDSELRKTLTELFKQEPAGLILDLRNNGGGYLQTAVEVASEFIDKGTLLIEVYGDGTRDVYEAKKNGMATNIPLVVLVNEGTASASEILAGAIQDYGRAALVGVTTYGKGSVQKWIPLSGDEGAVRVTVARWLTPKERQINEIGLSPDYEVKMTPEDIQANKDPQLDKAIEVLLNLLQPQ